jgi:hypothetical protein
MSLGLYSHLQLQLTSCSIYRLKTLTFLIETDETPVTVRAAAIATLTKPLERLINGPLEEAQDNTARFRDLKVRDFDKLCDLAYTGILQGDTLPPLIPNEDGWEGPSLLSNRIGDTCTCDETNHPAEGNFVQNAIGELNVVAQQGSPALDPNKEYQNMFEEFDSLGLLNGEPPRRRDWANVLTLICQ